MSYETKQEEIDLRFLYRKIKQLLSFVKNLIIGTITNTFHVIIKRWATILLFCFLGSGVGFALFKYTRPVYTSTLVLTSSILRNDYCSDMIRSLNQFIQDNSPNIIAKKLNISLDVAKQIKYFEFDNYNERLKKKYDNKDTVVLGLPFKIKSYAYTNVVFDTLEIAIVNYLENNEFALTRKQIRINNLNSLQEKLQKNIQELDSLKLIVASNMIPRGTQSGFVFGQPVDPMNMFQEEIRLFKESLRIKSDLELVDNIQVIESFTPREKPDYPNLPFNIIVGWITGFIMGLSIALIQERKRVGQFISDTIR